MSGYAERLEVTVCRFVCHCSCRSRIELYNKRSEEAIEQTKISYEKICRKIIGNILSSKEDAEECLDDVYLALWDQIPPERPGSLCAYICRISRRSFAVDGWVV